MQELGPAIQGFTGTISLRLTDLIQMVCLSRSDLMIEIVSRKGTGSISIRQGQIHHAQTNSLSGSDAFFEILQWNDGRFEILPFAETGINSVNKPWEHLLLEAMRLQDEQFLEAAGDTENGGCRAEKLPETPGPDILTELDAVLENLLDFNQYPDVLREKEAASKTRLKVLVVDDSAFFSKKLKSMLESDHDIEVAGIARNGKEALEFLESGVPVNLITLDINMPVMAGDTTLKNIMIRYQTPVIIISSVEPASMEKVFGFLRLGAMDFVAKPGVHNDLSSFGANLRKLARGVAKARVSNFRRMRKADGAEQRPFQTVRPAERKLLLIVGGEGAHMEWTRLPLQELCSHFQVIGIQKLDEEFACRFAQFIGDKTGVRTEVLSNTHEITPGVFYLTNARREARFQLRSEKPIIDVDVIGSSPLDWESGVKLWLERAAEQARETMAVYFMSAAQPLPGSLIDKLLARKVRQILSPPESVVCAQMIDCVKPYADGFPDLVFHSSPQTLPEVL